MDGVGGKPGWAWIFIIEGLATILVSIGSFWMVHDFPDEATFLSDEDRRRVIRRLKLDQQSSAEHEEFKMEYVWTTLKDWKTYTGMLVYMGVSNPQPYVDVTKDSTIQTARECISASNFLTTSVLPEQFTSTTFWVSRYRP